VSRIQISLTFDTPELMASELATLRSTIVFFFWFAEEININYFRTVN